MIIQQSFAIQNTLRMKTDWFVKQKGLFSIGPSDAAITKKDNSAN